MRLPALQTSNSTFALAQFDQVELFSELLGFDLETETGRQYLAHLKILMTEALSGAVSGVILDPLYGFGAIKFIAPKTGLAIRMEGLGHGSHRDKMPQLLPDWGVEQNRNNYALAKFELSYHPAEEQALAKKQLLVELHDFCQYEQIDFLVVVRLFNPEGGVIPETEYEAVVLEAAQELAPSCNLLGLEYPGSSLMCATLSAELDTPWLLVSHYADQVESYDQFKQHLRESLDGGGQGFIAGEAVWHELEQFRKPDYSPDWDAIEQFLKTTVRDRLLEITRIAQEHKS